MSKLESLYQNIILEHKDKPKNYYVLENYTHSQFGNNPMCGDEVEIYVDIVENKIQNISFQGTGCAICMASASLLTEAVKEKSIEDTNKLIEQIKLYYEANSEDFIELDQTGEIGALQGVKKYPARKKCAALPVEALEKILNS